MGLGSLEADAYIEFGIKYAYEGSTPLKGREKLQYRLDKGLANPEESSGVRTSHRSVLHQVEGASL